MRTLYGVFLLSFVSMCYAAEREIAITIDDLPLVASKMNTPGNQQRSTERFAKIIQALVENNVPATGFVIAGAIEKVNGNFSNNFIKRVLPLATTRIRIKI